MSEAEPYKRFSVECFPEPARGFIESASRALGVDESFVGLPLLAALSAAVGNARAVQVKPGWVEPAVVWTAIVGPSGTMKTPAMKAVLKPLYRRQEADLARYREQREAYDVAAQRHALAVKSWKSNGGEGEPPAEPTRPTMRRTLASDATTEAVARLLQSNPRGILLAVDELAGWLDSFNAYRSGGKGPDAARWLEIWNANTLVIDRVKDAGEPVIVGRAAVSVTGGIQPSILARSMVGSNTENGLSARLLVAMPPVRPALWTDEGVDPGVESAMAETFDNLLALSGVREDDGSERPRLAYLSTEATKIYRKWHDCQAEQQAGMSEADAAVWSKLKGYAARFALLLHFCELCGPSPRPEIDLDTIDGTVMVAACALADWFGDEALRVAHLLAEDEDKRERLKLVDRIKAMGGTATVRDIQRGGGKYRLAEAAKDALKLLDRDGFGVFSASTPGESGGRPSERFTLAEKHGGPEGAPTTSRRRGHDVSGGSGLAVCRPVSIAEADSILLDD